MARTFGDVLRELRLAKSWSMPKLSLMSKGVSVSNIKAIESRGDVRPGYDTVVQLASAFGAEGGILFETAGYPKPLPKPIEQMTAREMIREGLRLLEEEERKRQAS